MDISFFVDYIIQHGYIALFLSFYVGLIGLPVPNEVLIMTGGLLSTISYFDFGYTFLIIYVTIIMNATLLFIIGRVFGDRLLNRMMKYNRFQRRVKRASRFLDRYGSYTASLCYFLPIVRHMIPFLLGSNRYSYFLFALFSYSTAFIWAICLFMVGRLFGNNIQLIGEIISVGGYALLGGIGLLVMFYLVIRKQKNEDQKLDPKPKV